MKIMVVGRGMPRHDLSVGKRSADAVPGPPECRVLRLLLLDGLDAEGTLAGLLTGTAHGREVDTVDGLLLFGHADPLVLAHRLIPKLRRTCGLLDE